MSHFSQGNLQLFVIVSAFAVVVGLAMLLALGWIG